MSIENKQDAAEPSPASAGSVASAGTLRDTFAAAALTGLLSSLPNGDQYHPFAVEKAWSLADAMLRERERRRCPVSSQENLTLTDAERGAVAWAVVWPGDGMEIDCEWVYPDAATAGDVALSGTGIDGRRGAGAVVPLYRSPTLTDAEREALKHFAAIDGPQYLPQTTSAAATIRGLLERLK